MSIRWGMSSTDGALPYCLTVPGIRRIERTMRRSVVKLDSSGLDGDCCYWGRAAGAGGQKQSHFGMLTLRRSGVKSISSPGNAAAKAQKGKPVQAKSKHTGRGREVSTIIPHPHRTPPEKVQK